MKGRAMFVIFMVLLSTMPPSIACGYCPPPKGKPPGGGHKPPPKGKPPPHGVSPSHPKPPPVVKPPPSHPKPPPVVKPPPSGGSPSHPKPPPVITPPTPPSGGYPPYTPSPTPPSGGSPLIPPVTPIIPPVTPIIPPVTPITPPGSSGTCPKDALKLGACVDLLGGLVHVGIGDPAANVCCPLLQGLVSLEAAICLCTAIRLKLLNLNIYLPIALQLLATCGTTPPAGFTCPAN